MAGHVEVNNLPSTVLDNDEAIEELESRRRHGEKSNAWEIPADACFRDDEAELLAILGAAQIEFSFAKPRMSVRTSAVVLGLPTRAHDRHFQKAEILPVPTGI
jgi:hypothetical protein